MLTARLRRCPRLYGRILLPSPSSSTSVTFCSAASVSSNKPRVRAGRRVLSRGEGRRLATKGTKSTKGRTTDLDLPFVLFVPFVANLLPWRSPSSINQDDPDANMWDLNDKP